MIIPRTHISAKIITSLHFTSLIASNKKGSILSSIQICNQLLVFSGVKLLGMWKFPLISIYAEVKKECSCNSSLLMCFHSMDRDDVGERERKREGERDGFSVVQRHPTK